MAIGHLGKYERLDVLGSGASGVVYLAYDTLLRRQVALKEVRGAGPELDRVLSEARLLDRLRHPSLIAVHAVDEIDGVVVIDMELIRGSNLSEVMRARNRRPLPLDEALTIAVGILDGLAHAHDHRVLHRDIKPANILIGTDGRTVKLTDFGLAELLSSTSLAGGGGTYPYMAPEDFDETAGSDRRSDLWSVGVVVYEMVTGRRPFVVEKTRDPFAWKRVIDNTEPIHVSHLGLGLPSELDVVLTKALSKSKDDRYQDARSFRDALLASAGVAPAAVLTESRPNADTRMRIPTPEPQLTTELSPLSSRMAMQRPTSMAFWPPQRGTGTFRAPPSRMGDLLISCSSSTQMKLQTLRVALRQTMTFRLTAASECSSSTASRTRMPLRLTRSKSTKQSLVFSTATLMNLNLNLKLNLQRMSVKSMS